MATGFRGRTARFLLPASFALALSVAAVGAVSAATPAHGRVTRGDVMAAFQARTTGGYLNLLRGHTVAAPVRGFSSGRISSFGDGTECSADWHYLGLTLLGGGGRAAAVAYLRATSVEFWIDGLAVAPIQTAIKPFVGTGIHGQWGISRGRILAPGSLTDGSHVLQTQITTPDGGVEDLVVTFTLDPSACV